MPLALGATDLNVAPKGERCQIGYRRARRGKTPTPAEHGSVQHSALAAQ